MLQDIFNKIDDDVELNKADLKYLLTLSTPEDIEALYKKAYEIKLRNVGDKVYFRGIVEFSNVCEKDCFYCGIRKSNKNVKRFCMKEKEIINSAIWSYKQRYGSVVLQSGEQKGTNFVKLIENVVKQIKERTQGQLGITLSLGEQTEEVFQKFFDTGAHRYLLRIETSNPELYRKLHPEDHDFERRKNCLKLLRDIGYQVGTGVMIGLPFQTIDDLVNDIFFYKEHDMDMIGMGPYIVHQDTPLAQEIPDFEEIIEKQITLSLKMIAVTRVFLKDINIAATTALQALHPKGREMGLKAGANIIMPNITHTRYREYYQLYQNKPCLDENSAMCRNCLDNRIGGIGESIGYDEWGDSPHFFKRQ